MRNLLLFITFLLLTSCKNENNSQSTLSDYFDYNSDGKVEAA